MFYYNLLCVITSILGCFGAVHTANHLPGSALVFVDGSFASLQPFVTFPLVLDFGGKK